MSIVTTITPSLRCLFPDPPAPGELDTCATAGDLAATANVVASFQVTAAMKILLGQGVAPQIMTMDLWAGRVQTISTDGARRADCPACVRGAFEFLNRAAAGTTSLCGRDAIQILPPARGAMDMQRVASRLTSAGTVQSTPHLVRCTLSESGLGLTVFPDGRAIVKGTSDPAVARSVYAKLIGT
jgi:adenylyltransferase/sulfurtransferase